MSKDRSYGDDEVRAIVERALEAQPARSVSHEDLLSIGAGVGLSTEVMEQAAKQVREERLSKAALARVVAGRRRGVGVHAFVFFAVNACLFAVNFLTTPGQWWFLFSVFGWGLGLLLHAGFGLFLGISPRRIARERRKTERLVAPGTRPSAERRSGVRVEGPLDDIEGDDDAADEPARSRSDGRR